MSQQDTKMRDAFEVKYGSDAPPEGYGAAAEVKGQTEEEKARAELDATRERLEQMEVKGSDDASNANADDGL